MNYLVEELSVCHKGVNIEVLEGVMYVIRVTIEVYNQTPGGPWKHCQEVTLTSVYLV